MALLAGVSSERDRLIGFDWELARNDEGDTGSLAMLRNRAGREQGARAAIHGVGGLGSTRKWGYGA